MSLYQRGGVWWIRFTTPDGRELRETTRTGDKRLAQEYHDRRKAECWRLHQLGERPTYTWKQAVLRWLDEHAHHRSLKSTLVFLRQLDAVLGHLALHQIKREHFETFIRQRQKDNVSAATINRPLATARAILNCARSQWEWIDQVPAIRLLQEPKQRIRWLTRDEVTRLLHELPPHLAAMARFSLATGLRESNVTHLRWNQLDLERKHGWIHADQSKNQRAIPIPLNEDAMQVLIEQYGQHPEFVFTFRGEPVTRANNNAWRNAVKRAGLIDLRWHDLRHTWASWHVQAGTPTNVLQVLGGWSQPSMVQRYAHLGTEHLAEYAVRISHNLWHNEARKEENDS
jgi:integrase